jgi:hypothetical protein
MATVLIERARHLKGEEKPPAFAEVAKTTEQIQQRAFRLFTQHGGLPGFDLDNWLLAQREVLGPSAAELVESEKELRLRVAVPGADALCARFESYGNLGCHCRRGEYPP